MHRLALVIALGACGKVNTTVDARAIDALSPPVLDSVAPTAGIITTVVTLTGRSFGAGQGSVTIGGLSATVQSWSDTQITAVVPDLKPASVDIVATTAAGATMPAKFRVTLPPRAYIHNQATDAMLASDTITIMTFDPMTKALSPVTPNVAIGMQPLGFGGCDHSLVINEPTRRLFVTGNTGVAVFDIDPITGILTAVQGSPFVGLTSVEGLDVNAAGTRVWVGQYSAHVAVYDVGATGALTPVVGSPFTTPNVDVLVLAQNEQFVYGNDENNTFAAFSSSSAGAIASLAGSPYTHGFFTFYIARRPGTDQIFLPGANGLAVWLAAANGVPAQIAGSPFMATKPPGGTNNAISFTSDANRAYISGQAGTYITGVSLATDGTPTVLATYPMNLAPAMANINCNALSRDDSTLVVTDAGAKVDVLALAADGSATVVAGSPFSYTATTDVSGLAITF